MTVHVVAPIGSLTEQPDDIGTYDPFFLGDDLVTGDLTEVDSGGSTGGFPPAFPWSGHSNGVSSDR